MKEQEWIPVAQSKPEFTFKSGHNKESDIVDVKFNNGKEGTGFRYNTYQRGGWKSKEDGSKELYWNQAWGGIYVTHWRKRVK